MNELTDLARVRDDELAGRASGAGARALLASVAATDPAERPSPVPLPGAASRRRARRLLAGALATAALAAAMVLGPSFLEDGSGPATSYANAAIEIEQRGDWWVARIRDPFADHALYSEAFRAVGLDVTLELVPVPPDRVGEVVKIGGSGTTGPSLGIGGELEPEGCTIGQAGCALTVQVGRDLTGKAVVSLGRVARPGESYQSSVVATRKGQMLAGFRVDERPVREVMAEVRRRGLKAVFRIIDPNENGGGYGMDPAAQSRPVGDDWTVWEAEADRPGVVRLYVSEKRVAQNPIYGGPKPPEDTSE
ncbi:hypothetical protein [Nonomuraea rhodomycinica]|uniref:Uncharacterized protein n=1 Tax=Nonomuraea rhodomycinica TaxID=1712872 RepID=A0A7Y6IM65_9ACTN|nr:hypothetical protein [Nonomuraea rhodomycinica]NUW40558.1 hypothetical protein [Nonomuraea rhodomycinica]